MFELLKKEKKRSIMQKMTSAVRRLLEREDAPTMVEYGLLIGLIALVVAIAAAFLGTQVSAFFQNVGNSF